jgi:hypothetical protein
VPFAGYDVIVAIECLYYLSPAEQDAVMDKVATEHRGKPFILSVPIIGGKYFTHAGVAALLSRHGMRLVEFRNVTVHWDTPVKRTVQIALRLMPLRDRLIDYVPSGLIYQRCYVATQESEQKKAPAEAGAFRSAAKSWRRFELSNARPPGHRTCS